MTWRLRTWRYWRNLLVAAVVGLVPICYTAASLMGMKGTDEWLHPYRQNLCCTPADIGMEYEDANFITEDGLTLSGWYLPSKNSAAVFVMHGIHSNRESVFAVVEMLHKHGYGVLAFDARAHGESGGDTLTAIWKDGLAAVDYLRKREDVDPNRIGAWGFSLGGLMVIQSAAVSTDIRAVAADGVGPAMFEDLPARQTIVEWLYLPYDLAFFGELYRRADDFALMSTKAAVSKISPRPLLLISAAGNGLDQQLEQRMTAGFYEVAVEPKTLWQIEGAGHGGGFNQYREEYEQRIITFFDAALQ